MALIPTNGTYLKLPEETVHTEYDLQMLGVYSSNEITLADAGFHKIEVTPYDQPDFLHTLLGYTYELVEGRAVATAVVGLKDHASVSRLLQAALATDVDTVAAVTTSGVKYCKLYRTEYAFRKFCNKCSSAEKLLSVYKKIFKYIKEHLNG